MVKKNYRKISVTELDKALAELEAEQKAWYAMQRNQEPKKTKIITQKEQGNTDLLIAIGEYLESQAID